MTMAHVHDEEPDFAQNIRVAKCQFSLHDGTEAYEKEISPQRRYFDLYEANKGS